MKLLRSAMPLMALIVGGIALFASGLLDRFDPATLLDTDSALRARIAAEPVAAGLIHVAAMTLVTATGLPGAVLVVLTGGMLFGTVMGTTLSAAGLLIGSGILYVASRRAFSGVDRPASPLLARIRSGYEAHPICYTLFLRSVSFFPYGAVTVALAGLRCPPLLFFAASAVGGTIMTAVETYLGAGIANSLGQSGPHGLHPLAQGGVLFPMLGIALLSLAPMLVSRARRGIRPSS